MKSIVCGTDLARTKINIINVLALYLYVVQEQILMSCKMPFTISLKGNDCM